MKLTKSVNLLVLGLVLTVAASGCRKKTGYLTPLPPGAGSSGDTAQAGQGGKVEGGQGGTGAGTGGGIAANPPGSHSGWAEDASIFKADTVYFAFDSSAIKPEEKSKISTVAEYLKSNAANAVRVEGSCDERGTAEYNRALGERRALAVREELVGLGIEASRVDTISYGFDRPAVEGHDESAWSKNRRAEFILLSPPK